MAEDGRQERISDCGFRISEKQLSHKRSHAKALRHKGKKGEVRIKD